MIFYKMQLRFTPIRRELKTKLKMKQIVIDIADEVWRWQIIEGKLVWFWYGSAKSNHKCFQDYLPIIDYITATQHDRNANSAEMGIC